jgi:hypothetical protein
MRLFHHRNASLKSKSKSKNKSKAPEENSQKQRERRGFAIVDIHSGRRGLYSRFCGFTFYDF